MVAQRTSNRCPHNRYELQHSRSPGQYCKQSSWSTPHHRHRGTKSGIDAAQRLVWARRELTGLIRAELRAAGDGGRSSARKIYAVRGHGVPAGLFRRSIEAARGWLALPSAEDSVVRTKRRSLAKISFSNTPNSMMLDQTRIRTQCASGVDAALPPLPGDWEGDFELYMTVMDRMASRLASVAIPPRGDESSSVNLAKNGAVAEELSECNFAATLGTGSIVTPSRLTKWDVTITKGEVLPVSLLPVGKQGRHRDGTQAPRLTLEWARRKERDFLSVILRLQDGGAAENDSLGAARGPLSMVFDGEYVSL